MADGVGGVRYLLKDRVEDLEDFADAVRRVARGGSVIDPEVVAQLVGRRRSRVPIDDLSEREREVLALMAEGRSNQAIAERSTVQVLRTHQHRVGRRRLGDQLVALGGKALQPRL